MDRVPLGRKSLTKYLEPRDFEDSRLTSISRITNSIRCCRSCKCSYLKAIHALIHTKVCRLHYNASTFVSPLSFCTMRVINFAKRNMFLNYIGKPSIYLPCCMMVWGTISILTGITTKYAPSMFLLILNCTQRLP